LAKVYELNFSKRINSIFHLLIRFF